MSHQRPGRNRKLASFDDDPIIMHTTNAIFTVLLRYIFRNFEMSRLPKMRFDVST